MNLPHNPTPDWESQDASDLRAFLATRTGAKLFSILQSFAPPLAGVKIEDTALQAKFVAGYEFALTSFSALAAPSQPEEASPIDLAYPPLDSDEHWEGPKLKDIDTTTTTPK